MVKIGKIFIFKISQLFQHGINMKKNKMGVQRREGLEKGPICILALSHKTTGEALPHTHTVIINIPRIRSLWMCPQFPIETDPVQGRTSVSTDRNKLRGLRPGLLAAEKKAETGKVPAGCWGSRGTTSTRESPAGLRWKKCRWQAPNPAGWSCSTAHAEEASRARGQWRQMAESQNMEGRGSGLAPPLLAVACKHQLCK